MIVARILSIGVVLCLAACQTVATYPPVEGQMSLGDPAAEPVPTLMADAIRFARDHYHADPDLRINLPPATPPAVYDQVIAHLGDARPMQADDEQAYHVLEVRIRDLKAEVDLIYPRPEGMSEQVTIFLKRPMFGRFEVSRTRLWRIRVSPPPAQYVPPFEDEVIVEVSEDAARPESEN